MLIFVKSNLVPGEYVEYNDGESGDLISETRTIGDVDKLRTQSIRVILNYGEPALKIDAHEKLMDKVVTEVNDGELSISLKPGSYKNTHNKIKVFVTSNNLKKITARGGGSVFSEDTFTADQMDLEAHGGGNIEMTLQVIDSNANASGGGGLTLFGNVTNLKSNVHGGGWLEAYELDVKNADMHVSGGGNAKVKPEALTRAKATGGGTLYYRGSPTISNLDISGGGNIKNE